MRNTVKYTLAAAITATLGLSACELQTADSVSSEAAAPATTVAGHDAGQARELDSGIDYSGFDEAVRPQDDFFDYVNGTWVAETEMPADKARWGTFDKLRDQSRKDVRVLVEEVNALL